MAILLYTIWCWYVLLDAEKIIFDEDFSLNCDNIDDSEQIAANSIHALFLI